MTKHEAVIRRLVAEGYRVTAQGAVITPKGYERKLTFYKPKGNRTAYWQFNVKEGKQCYPVKVHKLIAFIKFGDEAFTKIVRHLDDDSSNNSWDNLALGDQSDNAMDRPVADRITHAKKANAAAMKKVRKLSEQDVLDIRASKESRNILAVRYGVAPSTISKARKGRTYTSVMVV